MIGNKILNYDITALLGEGGMGNVYLGEHIQLGRKVAIKMLHPKLASNSALRERFKNEASAMAHLQHPNIVALYDYIENDEGLFLIMEYVEGQELDDYIKNVTGPIGEVEIVKIMIQTLGAFEYAHSKGIVHRDIKPSNILLTKDGQVKVLDFGIAKLLDADKTLTKTGTQMGTVLYMSPEQVKGEKVDQRSDIYALGVTLFQMATGQAPYRTDTTEFEIYNKIVKDPLPKASSIYPGVSQKLETIIQRATEKDLNKRYQSCTEFLQDFRSASKQTVPEKTALKSTPKIIQASEKKASEAVTTTFQPKKNNLGKKVLWAAIIITVFVGGYFVVDHFINPNDGIATDSEPITENTVYVLSGELNFRSDKNVNASIIEVLSFGERVDLVGSEENPIYEEDIKIVWQKAKWNGKTGWIAKTMDDQDLVGDIETYEDFNQLFANDYHKDAGYSEMKVWAYYALIDFMKQQNWLGTYTIRDDPKEIRETGLKTVLRFRQKLNEKDEDDFYDFMVLLESHNEKIVIYLRADSKNSGQVLDWKYVPNHVNYLFKKGKKDEYLADGNYGLELIKLEETRIGAADADGGITSWLKPSEQQLMLEPLRYLETKMALTILSNVNTGYDFVTYDYWLEYNNYGDYSDPPVYWSVKNINSTGFRASQYIRSFGRMNLSTEIVATWKDTRYVTDDYQKAKLYIDKDLNRLVLYLIDNSGNKMIFYGCVDGQIIQDFLLNRDDYEEEVFGC